MMFGTFLLVIAFILFVIGAWSRWWPVAPERAPYYPSFMCAAFACWVGSILWPLITK